MFRNFSIGRWLDPRQPLGWLRLLAVVLAAANVAAAYLLVRPVGGSPAELKQQASEMRSQLAQTRFAAKRTGGLVEKVKTGRGQGEEFLEKYFLARRSAYSTILSELVTMAKESGIEARESTYTIEPVEGSATLEFMQVTANYQGTYANLIQFVNRVDRSERLLIIEGLQATPQQQGQMLNITVKLDAFVRDDASQAPMAGGAP